MSETGGTPSAVRTDGRYG